MFASQTISRVVVLTTVILLSTNAADVRAQTAACCTMDWDVTHPGDSCDTVGCQNLTESECEQVGGGWLGLMDPPVLDCAVSPPPCDLGSCCWIASCDDNGGDRAACLECVTIEGRFRPGLTCDLGACPVCPFKDAEHGQGETGDFMFSADLNFGIRVADDFIPAGAGVINRICYIHGFAPPGSGECADVPADDDLEVRFYVDNFGMPGTELIDSPGADVAWDSRSDFPGFRIWEYSAPLTGVQVEADTCYWISIQGHGRSDCILHWIESRDGNNYRVVDIDGTWDATDFRKSDYVFFLDLGIVPAITPRVDGGCGDIPVACCKGDLTCDDTGLLSECLAGNGLYFPIDVHEDAPWHSCDDIVCPGAPGDDCADAVPICEKVCTHPTDCALSSRYTCTTNADCYPVSGGMETCEPWAPCADNGFCSNGDSLPDGPICSRIDPDCYDGAACMPVANAEVYRCKAVSDNSLAETDGPPVVDDCGPHSPVVFEADVWHKITAPCTGFLVVDECNSLSKFDGLLAIFGDGSADYADTACPITTNDELITCNDDFCPGSATVGGFEIRTIKDATYLIRSGGWPAGAIGPNKGSVNKNIGFICPFPIDAEPPALPADAQHQAPKNRHISLDLSTNGLDTVAYKVTLSEMFRCSGDDRRSCLPAAPDGDPDACPGVCTGDPNQQCSDDVPCIAGGFGTCIPSGPCAPHGDVGAYWYIDTPFEKAAVPNNDMVGEYMANLVADPVFRVWPEATVHVTACEVVPVAAYDVRAVDQISGRESAPLTIGTIGKPNGTHYGDVVGIVLAGAWTPPQGVVTVTDVSAYLIGNQGGAGTTPPPHTTWIDLHGAEWAEACAGDTCTIPQAILSVSDLGRIKFGFLGVPYNVTPGHEDPGNCP